MAICVLILGLNSKKIEIKAYYGQSVEKETIEDFKFYNRKLQKIFLKRGILFSEVSCKNKKGVGYLVIMNGHVKTYEGVYTDVDFLDALNKDKAKSTRK